MQKRINFAIGVLLVLVATCLGDVIITENFDHSGLLPTGWTTESHASRGIPWHTVQDAGDDWSLSAGHTQYGNTDDEWLITPVFDLTGWADVELWFYQTYIHHLSSATLRYSDNAGVSWNPMAIWNVGTAGLVEFDVSVWADELSTVRFLFIFSGEFLSDGAGWNLDDFQLLGTPTYDDQPPIAFDPIPEQPMDGHWSSLTGSIGCIFTDPSGVDASTLQVRLDADGDGYYNDSDEDWFDVSGFNDADTVNFIVEVTYLEILPDMAFEFRAQDISSTNSLYGYSGYSNQEGIVDDWSLTIFFDSFAPIFSAPVPTGQPEPAWVDNRLVEVGCCVWDSTGMVDASTLALRLDLNSDLDYNDAGEEWLTLTSYSDSEYIYVDETVTFPTDGEFHVEFQATDIEGNGPAFSMYNVGIFDDILVRIDTTPPAAPYLMVESATYFSVTLMFSPTNDLTFSRYEVYVSTDSLVDATDRLWTDTDDPALGERSTYSTTVHGMEFGLPCWFGMRVIDGLNHTGAWSNTVLSSTEGSPLEEVADLAIAVIAGGVELTWTPPEVDVSGNTPVFIEGYDIHTSIDPFFTPTIETKIVTVAGNNYTHLLELSGDIQGYYRVVTLGNGITIPVPEGFTFIPAGIFMMGSMNGNGNEQPVHQVTITHNFYLGTYEVTNQKYLEAVQWAYDNGYVIATNNTVQAFEEELLDLDDEDCEISFSNGVFSLEMGTHDLGSYGPGHAYPSGYDPADHPVKEVSWFGAVCYCDWLSMMEGLEPFYNGDWSAETDHNPYEAEGYTLPTEAEWEYAASYNDAGAYPWGDESPTECVHANFSYCLGWTAQVGSYPMGNNQLGLQNMSGNVCEWVGDWSNWDYYDYSPGVDPLGPVDGYERILRGGDWSGTVFHMRCASRYWGYPYHTYYHIGFRVCRSEF